MVQAIDEFTRKSLTYDWKKWTNGRKYRAVKGQDFDCDPAGFGSTLYSKAYVLGKRVRVSVQEDFVEFQFLRRK